MNEITLNAYAKINLFLEVTGREESGFHTLSTFFQSVDLCDTLTLRRAEGLSLHIVGAEGLSCGEDNLVLRAARRFCAEIGQEPAFSVTLRKRIPMMAGLGGGSADAAATLLGLNLLCGEPLTRETMFSLAAELGSDVPFCLMGGSAFGEGRGTGLTPSPSLPACSLVIALGKGEKVSTAEAYRRIDTLHYVPVADAGMRTALAGGDLDAVCASLFNRFEDVSGQETIRSLLLGAGAKGALLSGSGAAVFGIFEKEEMAEAARASLCAAGHTAFLAHPL